MARKVSKKPVKAVGTRKASAKPKKATPRKAAAKKRIPAASRLATTVRAEDPTVLLNPVQNFGLSHKTLPSVQLSGKVGMRDRMGSGMSNVARRIIPGMKPGPVGYARNKKANRKLKKLAREIARGHSVKKRRSRLPLLILLVLGMLAGGGWFAWKSIPVGSFDSVSSVLDYDKWLSNVSGDAKPVNKGIKQAPRKVVYKKPAGKPVQRVVKSRAATSKKSVKKVVRSRAKSSKATAAQKKKWKKKLATLKNKSRSDYKKASAKYKKKK